MFNINVFFYSNETKKEKKSKKDKWKMIVHVIFNITKVLPFSYHHFWVAFQCISEKNKCVDWEQAIYIYFACGSHFLKIDMTHT